MRQHPEGRVIVGHREVVSCDSVHSERKHNAPQHRGVGPRNTAYAMFPNAEHDEERNPPCRPCPKGKAGTFNERSHGVKEIRSRPVLDQRRPGICADRGRPHDHPKKRGQILGLDTHVRDSIGKVRDEYPVEDQSYSPERMNENDYGVAMFADCRSRHRHAKKDQGLGAYDSKKPTATNNQIGSTSSVAEYQLARTEIREDGEGRERR